MKTRQNQLILLEQQGFYQIKFSNAQKTVRYTLLNQETEIFNKKVLRKNEEKKRWVRIQAQQKVSDLKIDTNRTKNRSLIRSFEIENFGIWNCDHPMLQNKIKALRTFQDTDGHTIKPEYLSVAFKDIIVILPNNWIDGES